MHETVQFWLNVIYEDAINDAKETIKNEHMWELGYSGEDPNPHTENIALLNEYVIELEKRLDEVNRV